MSFMKKDFLKSGISEETINAYIESGYLKEDAESWTLYYPELFSNEKTEYYNKRIKNYTDSKYIKPKGETSRLFRPLDLSVDAVKNDYLIITEGEKKSIKAVQEGFNCVALAGVWGWKQKTEETDEDFISADIIPDLVELDLRNKVIYLCYDNDMWSKEEVKNALYHFCLYLLYEKGAIVKIIKLPKSNEKLGLDDYLIKYGKEEFQKLLDNAEVITVRDIQISLSGIVNGEIKFPLEVFSSSVAKTLNEIAENLDAPIEYIASSYLVGASTLMNGKFSVVANKFQNWIETPILWGALIGSPSQKKSPSLKIIKKLIDKYEEEMNNDYLKKQNNYYLELENYKVEMKKFEKNKLSANEDNSIILPMKPQMPLKQRLTTQNATVEALITASYNNEQDSKRGVCIWVDELAFLFKGLGQYKKGGNDEEYLLQTWSKQNTNIIRQDKDYTIKLGHSIIGTIQPEILNKTLFANGIDSYNGMIERWLLVTCNDEETGIYAKNLYDLKVLESRYDSLFYSNTAEEIKYEFSAEAQEIFDSFCSMICERKKQNDINNLMKNYLQKQTNYVARFALILHCLENSNKLIIEVETVKNAIKLSGFYTSSFEKIIKERLSKTPLTNETINYLYAKNLATISPSKLYKSNTSKYRSKENAKIVLENLANEGKGRIQKSKNGGIKFVFYK